MHMNLSDALTLLCVDDLKDLARHLPGPTIAGRKADLAAGLAGVLLRPELPSLWQKLDENQKAAVAEAAHDPLGEYSAATFQAKYRALPAFVQGKGPVHSGGGRRSTPLGLFIHQMVRERDPGVPADLRKCLLAFVPEPATAQINTVPELDAAEDRVIRLTERAALQELTLMLRTIDKERITVGEKTAQPSTAAQRLISARLPDGDFYPWVEKADKWEQQVGPIKAFAWPLLLQAGGLAARTASRLSLSPAGFKALNAAPAEVIRTLWRKWMKTNLLDEFSRIDVIKGQNSAGRVMSALAPRREVIEEALQACPLGEWIDVREFSRFMQASDLRFIVAHDPWKLFIGERQYGSLGYDGCNGWNILQHRYILALLFEYAATLGMVDVAYFDPTDPEGGEDDFRSLWGAEELTFLSRYDGLSHFRLNRLGAFVLGLADHYQAATALSTVGLYIAPSLSIGVVNGALDAQAQLTLGTWAQSLPDGLWQLDHAKALDAIEKGHDIGELQQFLANHVSTALPDAVSAFIARCDQDAKAVKTSGTAVLLTCRDAATAQRIASHKATHRLCLATDPQTLMVRTEQLNKFREALRQIGFGMLA